MSIAVALIICSYFRTGCATSSTSGTDESSSNSEKLVSQGSDELFGLYVGTQAGGNWIGHFLDGVAVMSNHDTLLF